MNLVDNLRRGEETRLSLRNYFAEMTFVFRINAKLIRHCSRDESWYSMVAKIVRIILWFDVGFRHKQLFHFDQT